MPIYEYQCGACDHHLEALQKISDEPLRKCPACGRSKLRRLISPPVFRLRGSGWYETDFKSDKEGRRNLAGPEKDDGASSDTTAAKPSTGADDKAAAEPPARQAESGAEKAKPAADGGGARKKLRKPARVAKSRAKVAAAGKRRR